MKYAIIVWIFIMMIDKVQCQDVFCLNPIQKNFIKSKELNEDRNYWVSLPLNYSDSVEYPVIYVLDAEWRFELVQNLAFELGGHHKINKSIIIGIPHVDWEKKRGIDLTFSYSRREYDGDWVDSTWYTSSNSGGGEKFYKYLINELIPDVNKKYSTNNHETLIGHSYGGYFGGYLLSLDHPFDVLHLYDPSVWYSDGEIIFRLKNKSKLDRKISVHITYQPLPEFHKKMVEKFITELNKDEFIILSSKKYEKETHNSLFLDSFLKGIQITN